MDQPFAAAAFAEKLGVDIPLLGDWPLNETCKAYGTYNEERHVSSRQSFVVDKAGTVRAIISDRDATRHPPEALRALQELRDE